MTRLGRIERAGGGGGGDGLRLSEAGIEGGQCAIESEVPVVSGQIVSKLYRFTARTNKAIAN